MGKPFKKEISESLSTIKWALQQDTKLVFEQIFLDTTKPLYIVGSGGSLSACYFAATIYQYLGNVAKAITPLELYYSRFALKDAKVLFISSSGRNNDILFAFNMAIQNHANDITTICMRRDTPLTKLANSFSVSKGIEYDIPTKKDGFLATNSLTAFFTILAKASRTVEQSNNFSLSNFDKLEIENFVKRLHFDSAITVLYSGWSTPVAYDLESKFTEAALGSVLLADYRNFGHGRHHWFAKREINSAIIALVTPEEKKIAEKTINLLPSFIPRLILTTENENAFSSIDLLMQVYDLVNSVGEQFNIDPGKPGVPEFGSKLYHLKYSSFYKQFSNQKLSSSEEFAILKKACKSSIVRLTTDELEYWRKSYKIFINKINSVEFASIVFDYDGTLCSGEDRFKNCLPDKILNSLLQLLQNQIVIGIATGRGKSVREVLQNSVPEEFWNQIIIGYYNGSDVAKLSDNNKPNTSSPINKFLEQIEKELMRLSLPYKDIEIKLRPSQLTIETKNPNNWKLVKGIVQNLVMINSKGELQLLESSHSLDVIVKTLASKLNVVNECKKITANLLKNENCLTIGDKGQWPGNDYELLATEYSLSVDDVSSHPETCWNLSDVGLKGIDATLSYLERIKINNNKFRIKL